MLTFGLGNVGCGRGVVAGFGLADPLLMLKLSYRGDAGGVCFCNVASVTMRA
jgi:hypothetical protein